MAASKKYAGLPDLDVAPEVYETPELADDVSTAQTGTVRTISPNASSSDDSDNEDGHRKAKPGLDRQPVDRESARRRFGASRVDARDVDFSDAIGGSRRSYRTRSSRRRRVRNDRGDDEIVYMSDSEDETLARRLARLKREAEEVRLQLMRAEREKENNADGEFVDSVEQQQTQLEEGVDVDGVEALSRALDGLSVKAGLKGLGTAEADFISRLDSNARQRQRLRGTETQSTQQANDSGLKSDAPTTLSAVAAFSDRLTALEAALGLSSISAESQTRSILPRLDTLSSQVSTIFTALNAPAASNPAMASATHTTPLLDNISSKLKLLIAESKSLEQARKTALDSLEKLHDTRMNNLVSATVHTNTRPRRGLSTTSGAGPSSAGHHNPNPHSTQYTQLDQQQEKAVADYSRPDDETLQITSRMFLEEQAAKVTALYQLLPSIQHLQPLLPVVLERLRALNVIHAGAADAKNALDDVERRQGEMKAEVAQWRDAVEAVEKGMQELEESMKGNVEVVGDLVGGLEGRLEKLGAPAARK